jgi:TrmH family RNA methyltransferase
LQRPKGRQKAQAFLVEGERAIFDALQHHQIPRALLVREDYAPTTAEYQSALRRYANMLRIVSEKIFPLLTETVTPQGIVGIFPIPSVAIDSSIAPLVVVADGLQDPGNLGTLLRSAAGAGATLALISPGTVDPYNPKVVRGAMGAHFSLPILPLNEQTSSYLTSAQQRLVAEAGASTPYHRVDWREPSAIVIGSEALGPSAALRALATGAVAIPLERDVESLNAAVAGSIILFEAQRQRRFA